jgi:multidrug efflux system membrane fusion protein
MAEGSGKRRWRTALLLAAVAAGAAAAAWYVPPQSWPSGLALPWAPVRPTAKQAVGPSPALVQVEPVAREDFPIYLSGLGLVQASNTVTVRSRVDGQVQSVGFKEGEFVKEGDVLVQLDPSPFKAALDQVTAKLAQDQANLANAQRDLERTTSLVANGNATRQLFDQQTSNVAQLKALILADQAGIESARVQLDYATIHSPLSGRAGLRLVDAGNIVHAVDQTGIVTIAQIEPVAVIFSIPENRLGEVQEALRTGAPQVIASTPDGNTELAIGKLSVIDNQVDTTTGTVKLKALFDNADHKLWPGMSISARLVLRTETSAVVVPDKAVQRGPNGPYVYVVTDARRAELRPVKIADIVRGRDLVASGLSGGERVITAGHYKVQPNGLVQVGTDKAEQAPIAPQQPAGGAR